MTKEEFLKGIAKAKDSLKLLIGSIKNQDYEGSDYLWVGADIAIDTIAPPKSTDWWPPQDDYVVTPYCKELSWLFIQLRDIFYKAPLIDAFNKYEFFGGLADAASKYIASTKDGIGNKDKLLMATHKEAEIMLKEILSTFPHGE